MIRSTEDWLAVERLANLVAGMASAVILWGLIAFVLIRHLLQVTGGMYG